MPMSGTARAYGSSIFSFLRNHYTVSHSGFTNLDPHSSVAGLPLLHILSGMCFGTLFNDGHSDWHGMIPHYSLDLHSLIVILSIFSCVYWLSVFLLWRNVCLGLLPIFQLGSLFFVVAELYEMLIYFGN